jgi:hypothetical protein
LPLCEQRKTPLVTFHAQTLEFFPGLRYRARVKVKTLLAVLVVAVTTATRAQDTSAPSIANFANVTEGRYQVFAQGGHQLAFEVNMFMNQMLRQYEKFFNNWSGKAGARVVVFDNVTDFRNYAGDVVSLTHAGLAGYCHLKTDEAGNQFYEVVTYQDANLWRVLAHEGFHQFIGYELGLQIPTWLNEGTAQYFETSFITGSHFNVGQISRNKLLYAQALIVNKKAPPLAQLVTWDQATFYANANLAYPTSWALVYYLLNSNNDRYEQSRFRHYLQDLKFGNDSVRSLQKNFGSDMTRWQADFEDYILHLKPQTD